MGHLHIPGWPAIHLRVNMLLELKIQWKLMTAHLLLTVAEQKNPWEQEQIITGLTRIMPSTNVDKSELINYEKLKAAKYIIHMCVCLHVRVQPAFS